ncbi:MAG: biotin--[acetyl-CoA-carboxylase] ligase [Gemmatimonadota bacterium]|nr:biotin--[acetyl-CoA-carboxylase] ligase [Gemmatimonadota bacterium]
MIVCTDNVEFGERIAPRSMGPWTTPPPVLPGGDAFATRLFGARPWYVASTSAETRWPCLFAAESADRSQFDTLVSLSREGADLPDGIACLAGAGRGLHGQRGRPWAALSGNLHLSLWLTPPAHAVRSPIAILALGAVSVVEAIDGLPGLTGRAGIKWVNDILLDGAKVCGILTHVETRATGIRAILGIGLNVEVVPDVPPTPFVPAVTALRAAATDPEACRLGRVLHRLLAALGRNDELLRADGPDRLFARYRERSLVLGRDVALYGESGDSPPCVLAEGRVAGLGPQLELLLDGQPRPFTTGRLILRPR